MGLFPKPFFESQLGYSRHHAQALIPEKLQMCDSFTKISKWAVSPWEDALPADTLISASYFGGENLATDFSWGLKTP